MTQYRFIESFAIRKRILNANWPRRRARTRRGERAGGCLEGHTSWLTTVRHDLTILRTFGRIAARCGRRAERTGAYCDRADRLKPNIVFSRRYSYQRRGHVTVGKVSSCRLTLPRTRHVGQELPEKWLSREHAFIGADPRYSGKLSPQFAVKPPREAFPTVPRAPIASHASFGAPCLT